MDNPTTLLVAIMFVTILAMAIGNILMTCAEIAGGLRRLMPEHIQLNWIYLMLFATGIITAPVQDGQSNETHRHYFELRWRFFVMLALYEAWILGIDYCYVFYMMKYYLSGDAGLVPGAGLFQQPSCAHSRSLADLGGLHHWCSEHRKRCVAYM